MAEDFYTTRVRQVAEINQNLPSAVGIAFCIAELAMGMDELREQILELQKAQSKKTPRPWRSRA